MWFLRGRTSEALASASCGELFPVPAVERRESGEHAEKFGPLTASLQSGAVLTPSSRKIQLLLGWSQAEVLPPVSYCPLFSVLC